MSLAVTFPVAALNETVGIQSSYSLAAFTPTANSFLVLFVILDQPSSTAGHTVSGGSLTWTKKEDVSDGGLNVQGTIWTAPVGASPASTTITYDLGGQDAGGCHMVVAQVTGQNAATPVAQTKSGTGTAANPSLALTGAMSTGNAYLLGAFAQRNPAAITEPAGWTEQIDQGHIGPTSGFELSYRINGETGSTVGVTSASSLYVLLFIEIAPAAANATLTAAAGNFSLTGNAALLRASRALAAAVGTFTVSGQAALLRWGHSLTCSPGSFLLTGNATTLGTTNRRLIATSSLYFVTGIAARLRVGHALDAETGAFSVAGNPAAFQWGHRIVADPGQFAVRGNDAALRMAFRLTASAGTFTEIGYAAGMLHPFRLQVSPGAYVVSGQPAGLRRDARLHAEAGTFVVTGNPAALRRSFPVIGAGGTFIVTGNAATLRRQARLKAECGRFNVVAMSNLHPNAGFILEAIGGGIVRTRYAGFSVPPSYAGFLLKR